MFHGNEVVVNPMLTSSPGKSDPFVVFFLNGQRVHKSQTKKKTLAPEWNENFVVQVVRYALFFLQTSS